MRIARLVAAGAVASICVAATAAGDGPAGLKPVASFERISDRQARSVALFREMGKVIQSPRCLNCHPRSDRPSQTDDMLPHSPPVSRGPSGAGEPGLECTTCHGPANATFATGSGSVPGDAHWQLAPREMAWQGYSLGEICRQISDPARNGGRSLQQIVDHMGKDHLVGWGWRPGPGRKRAPGTQQAMGELSRAWVDSGAYCPK
jgi:hypothetical protein